MVGNVGGLNNRLDVMMDYNINNAGNVNAVPHAGNGNGAPSVGQQIKTALQDFGNKVAEKFAAFKEKVSDGFSSIASAYREWKSDRAERAQLAAEAREARRMNTCEQLDKHDLETAPKSSGTSAATLGSKNRGQVSNELSNIMTKIDKEISENLDIAKSPKDIREAVLKSIVTDTSAMTLSDIDPKKLEGMSRKFASEGRLEKAEVLNEIIDLVKYSRTPHGAEDLFAGLATTEMQAHLDDTTTFLRQTSNSGTAAVRKLADAYGAKDYCADLSKAFKSLENSKEAKVLKEMMAKENVNNTSHPMSKELAEALAAFSVKAADTVMNVPVPDRMRDRLSDLANDISQRNDGHEDTLTHRLYADQLVLKSIGAEGAKLSPALKIAADLITKVGNQAKSGAKLQPEMFNAFSNVAPQLHNKLENYMVNNGMPQTAQIANW